jgi:DNA-binding MltR family transcriptional regulator
VLLTDGPIRGPHVSGKDVWKLAKRNTGHDLEFGARMSAQRQSEPQAMPPFSVGLKSKQDLDEFRDFCSESDRSLAIVAAAIVDDRLGWAIRRRMPYHNEKAAEDLFGGDRPLAGPATRARLALLMGLCSELTYRDLLTINKIRNKFAHKPSSLTFKDTDIAKECMRLKLAETLLMNRKRQHSDHAFYDYAEDIKSPRERFLITAQLLSEVFFFDTLIGNPESWPLI